MNKPMKIIHCADIHLDSKMQSNLDKDKAKERKNELLMTFNRMLAYGEEQGVEAILIAGDLFDTKNISATARKNVQNAILSHPEMDFFYLKGNHDADGFLEDWTLLPENLHLFEDEWKSYPLGENGNVVVSGIELNPENSGSIYHSLVLETDKVNLVMLHGQETATRAKDKAETISIRDLKGKNIDYLALGHVHAYKEEQLDSRGIYCYPGCLEGRGFDECGEHGFVLLDIDEEKKQVHSRFIPFASRCLYTLPVDVTGCLDTAQILARVEQELTVHAYGANSLMKIVLTGQVDVECEKNISYLLQSLQDDFYFMKIYDETKLSVDYDSFRYDESLKGEFVRLLQSEESLTEEERSTIIRYGIQALAGEELQ
ncbi:MAG: exonuclease SbcCD subunit D [Roseburia sp.]